MALVPDRRRPDGLPMWEVAVDEMRGRCAVACEEGRQVTQRIIQGDCLETLATFERGTFDAAFMSPPYENARSYEMEPYTGEQWVSWMASIIQGCLRVCKGPVCVVARSQANYSAVCEGLIWELRRYALRPNIWHKNAAPNGRHWFSNEWEFVMAFAASKPIPYWNPAAIATPLKYKAGGNFRQRGKDDKRKAGSAYPTHAMRKCPPDVHYVTVGGGHMGSPLACEHPAPFPEVLVERFLPCICPPGSTVLDPFCGSGTTLAVAARLGMDGVGIDLNLEYCDLARRRLGLPLPGAGAVE